MATNFPTSVDNFTNPTANDSLNSPSHSVQHANANDAIEAVEDYLLNGAGKSGTVLLNTISFTTTTTVNITNCFNSIYTNYIIETKNAYATGGVIANGSFQFLVGSTASSGSYRWAGVGGFVGNSVQGFSNSGSSAASLGQTLGNKAGSFRMEVFNPYLTKQTTWHTTSLAGRGDTNETYWNAMNGWTDDSTNTYSVDGIKIMFDTACTGSIKILGIRD